MKNLFLTFLLLPFFVLDSRSQSTSDSSSYIKTSQLKANLNLLSTGLNYEMKIAKRTTINFEGFVTGSFRYNHTNNPYWAYFLAPALSTELRQYYNLDKRIRNNRTIRNNSGSFYGLTLGYQFSPFLSKNISDVNVFGERQLAFSHRSHLFMTPAWGMQRSVGKRINFEGKFGLSLKYFPELNQWSAAPAIKVGFGYVIK